ncbi:MAG: hypothetical protein SV760_06385, partial [Halobacteria archaeon]|nr:hypothetical protein [Halobacteria archaeon]
TGTQKSIAWSLPNGTGYTKVVTQNGTQYVPRGANVLSILTTQRFVDQLERLLGANTTTVGGVSTTTYEGETVWNVTASSTRGGQSQKITLFLTSSGNVRVIRTSSSGAQGGGGTFEIVFSNIGSTSVSPPDWIDEARNQTQSRSFRGSRPRAPSGS